MYIIYIYCVFLHYKPEDSRTTETCSVRTILVNTGCVERNIKWFVLDRNSFKPFNRLNRKIKTLRTLETSVTITSRHGVTNRTLDLSAKYS
jgi:hypothetical protein